MTAQNKFTARLAQIRSNHSLFCMGVDPSITLLKSWGLPVNAEGLRVFCGTILGAAIGNVGIVKPQSAYFEQFGPQGIDELNRFIKTARDNGLLVINDCKRGDIGATMQAYAHSYLSPHSAIEVDAITSAAYLGLETVTSTVKSIGGEDKGCFIVVRSSNPEGKFIQNAKVADGRSIAEYLCDDIKRHNADNPNSVSFGAVIGATLGQEARILSQRLENGFILAPGIGAQGASLSSLGETFGDAVSRVIPSASRLILSQGPTVDSISELLKKLTNQTAKHY